MKKSKKGFTLIEIIVCLVIISVITTISIVALVNKKDSEYDKNVKKVVNSADVYYSSNENLKQDLIKNGGYLVLSVEQLRNLGLLENELLVDGIDISELSDGESDYKKILLSNRNEDNDVVTLYYPLNGSPLNYSTTKYIYDNDLKDNQKNIDYLERNFFDKVYFYDNDFNRLNIECDKGVFTCGYLYIDNGSIKDNVDNVNIETLKNKMLSQQIKYQDESLTKNLFIYTAPILRVYGISDNTEKVITDTDFDKWYKNVRIDIVGVADDEAYLNGIKESNLSIFEDSNPTNNINKDEKTTSYFFNESGEYKYDYVFEAKSLENTLISSNSSNNKTIKVDNVLPVIEKINSDNSEIQYKITDDKSGLSKVYCSKNSRDEGDITNTGNNGIYECKEKYVIAYDNAKNRKIFINEEIKSIDEDDIIIKPIENSFSKFSVTVKNYSNYKDWLNISLSLKDYNYYSYEARLNNYFNAIIKKEENNTLFFEFDLVDVLKKILYAGNNGLDLYKHMEEDNKYNMFTLYVDFTYNNNFLKRYATNYSFNLSSVSDYFDGESNSYRSESQPYIVTNNYFVFSKAVIGSYTKNRFLYKVSINSDSSVSTSEIDKKIGDYNEYWYDTCFEHTNNVFSYNKVILERTISKKNGTKTKYYFYKCTINDKNCNYKTSSDYSSSCGNNSQTFDEYNFDSYKFDISDNLSDKISFLVGNIGYMEKKTGCGNCGRYSFSLDSQLLNGKLFITKSNNINYGIYFIKYNNLRTGNQHLYYARFELTPTVNKVAI